MTDFNILLEVDSVNISTLAITRHYHSDRHFVSGSGDTPASTQYIPNLDINNVQFYSQSIPVPGAGGPVPITDSPIVFSLARYVGSIDTDRLADYSGEEAEGQYARLIAVGNLPDGATSTLASPRILATGFVSKWLPLQDETIVQITRGQNALGKIIPADTFTGYRDGLWYDGVNDVSSTGVTSFPSSFSIMVRTLIPRGYSGAASFPSCFGNGSVFIGVDHSTPTTPYVGIQYRVSGGAVSAAGPLVVDTEKYYWICMSYSSGVGFTVYLDGESVDVAETTSLDDLSLPWVVGHAGTATPSSYFQGVISCVALFDTDLSNEEIISYQHARLNGDESNLVLFYPGESLSTTLYDYARANDPPADATISGASAVSTGEGDEGLNGTIIPVAIGYCRNVRGIPVDPTTQLYRFARSCERIVSVRDRGAAFTILAEYHSFDSFRSATPGAGQVVLYPPMALAKVGGTLGDQAFVTADIHGESSFDYSIGFGGSTYLNAGTGPNATLASPFSVEFDVSVGTLPQPPDNFEGVISNLGSITTGGFVTINLYDDSLLRRAVWVKLHNYTGSIRSTFTTEFSVDTNEQKRISITVDEVAGDIVYKMYVNGSLFDSQTDPSMTIPPSSPNDLVFGTYYDLALGSYATYTVQDSSIGRVRIWNEVITESKIRSYLFDDPDPVVETGLVGLWVGSNTSTANLPDDAGSSDAAFVGAGPHVWRGGISDGWPIGIAMSLLRRFAGVDSSLIEISESAWLSSTRGSSLYMDKEGRVDEYLSLSLASIDGWAIPTPGGKIRIGATSDPDLLTSSKSITASDVSEVTRIETVTPPETFSVGYGANWTVQAGDQLVASVSDTSRAFWSKASREHNEKRKSNATRYPPGGRISRFGGLWTSRQAAAIEARRVAALHDRRPELFRVTLAYQMSDIFPGDVVEITHGDLDSSGSNYLVVSVTSAVGGERVDSLEVWRPNA